LCAARRWRQAAAVGFLNFLRRPALTGGSAIAYMPVIDDGGGAGVT